MLEGSEIGGLATVNDINPALPRIRYIPEFLQIRVLTVMQDLYHQP